MFEVCCGQQPAVSRLLQEQGSTCMYMFADRYARMVVRSAAKRSCISNIVISEPHACPMASPVIQQQLASLHRTCMLAGCFSSSYKRKALGSVPGARDVARLVIADIGRYEQVEAAPLRVQRMARHAGAPCELMYLWFPSSTCLPRLL